MTPLQIIFLVIAAVVLGAALMVVTTRNLVHAALWLVVALFGVAALFVLLEAGFLAVAQVVIYIGAIAILFIFAVMLTRRIMHDTEPQTNSNAWVGALIALGFFGGLSFILYPWANTFTSTIPIPEDADMVQRLGLELISPDRYLIPFEVASALLLAALIGAIFVSWDRN